MGTLTLVRYHSADVASGPRNPNINRTAYVISVQQTKGHEALLSMFIPSIPALTDPAGLPMLCWHCKMRVQRFHEGSDAHLYLSERRARMLRDTAYSGKAVGKQARTSACTFLRHAVSSGCSKYCQNGPLTDKDKYWASPPAIWEQPQKG